jgi:NAD(P)-dependent dehydrogenase (short-subunit alcohol dehydrogenase family)
VAVVTGASRGIGRAVALRFAEEGAELVLVARTQGALEEVDDHVRSRGGRAALVPGDLTDFTLIDRLGGAVYERWARLDVLVGNAGTLGILAPVGHVPVDVWDRALALNLTANWRLIRSLDPLLRASNAGRAIFTTSRVAPGRGYWSAYAASKAALDSLVRSYAEEVRNTSIRANLIDPGPTRTAMRAQAYPGEDPATRSAPDDERLMDAFVTLAEAGCRSNGEIWRVQ